MPLRPRIKPRWTNLSKLAWEEAQSHGHSQRRYHFGEVGDRRQVGAGTGGAPTSGATSSVEANPLSMSLVRRPEEQQHRAGARG